MYRRPTIAVSRDDKARYSATLDGQPVELVEVSRPVERRDEFGKVTHRTVDVTVRENGKPFTFFEVTVTQT